MCVCKKGYIRKKAADYKLYKSSPCVLAEKSCPKPKTKAVHLCSKRKKLPPSVDISNKETWTALLIGMPEGVEVLSVSIQQQRQSQYNVIYRYNVSSTLWLFRRQRASFLIQLESFSTLENKN